MQLASTYNRRFALAIALFVMTFAFTVSPGYAALETAGFEIEGPGAATAGRELTINVSATNVSSDPKTTPEAIDRLVISSHSIRFNGDAQGVATCTARLPRNGDPANCPKSSKVGHGRVTGILGTPGKPSDMFGALSKVSGRFKLFNYKHPRGQPARMVAVITATKPFGGVSINLMLPVSRDNGVAIDIPPLSKLPPLIRNSYPKGTQVVLSTFKATIKSPPRQNSKPFAWLRHPGDVDVTIEAKS